MRPTRNINIQKPDIIKNHHLKTKKHPYNHTWTLQVWCQMNGKEGAIKQPLIFQGFFHHPLGGVRSSGTGNLPPPMMPGWGGTICTPALRPGRLEGGRRLTWGMGWLDLTMAGAGCWIPTPSNKGCLPKKKKNYPDLKLTCSHPKMGKGPEREIHVTKTSIFR